MKSSWFFIFLLFKTASTEDLSQRCAGVKVPSKEGRSLCGLLFERTDDNSCRAKFIESKFPKAEYRARKDKCLENTNSRIHCFCRSPQCNAKSQIIEQQIKSMPFSNEEGECFKAACIKLLNKPGWPHIATTTEPSSTKDVSSSPATSPSKSTPPPTREADSEISSTSATTGSGGSNGDDKDETQTTEAEDVTTTGDVEDATEWWEVAETSEMPNTSENQKSVHGIETEATTTTASAEGSGEVIVGTEATDQGYKEETTSSPEKADLPIEYKILIGFGALVLAVSLFIGIFVAIKALKWNEGKQEKDLEKGQEDNHVQFGPMDRDAAAAAAAAAHVHAPGADAPGQGAELAHQRAPDDLRGPLYRDAQARARAHQNHVRQLRIAARQERLNQPMEPEARIPHVRMEFLGQDQVLPSSQEPDLPSHSIRSVTLALDENELVIFARDRMEARTQESSGSDLCPTQRSCEEEITQHESS